MNARWRDVVTEIALCGSLAWAVVFLSLGMVWPFVIAAGVFALSAWAVTETRRS